MLKISRRLVSTLQGKNYDAVVIGGGHNGLVAAAYLAKAGRSVAVFERRPLLGGAAVTEEIIPGFKFSRASYLLGLLRPQVLQDLDLKRHGLKVHVRDPDSYVPCLDSGRSLLLGADAAENSRQISQFSKRDAEAYERYTEWLDKIAKAINPLLDNDPVDIPSIQDGSMSQRMAAVKSLSALAKTGISLGSDLPGFYELVYAPASKILDKWFESEPLKACLATDSVIGAMLSPKMAGSGYVLLHHVMGEVEGVRNSWGYVEGGNGALSAAVAKAAESHGAILCTDTPVALIRTTSKGRASGVVLEDGTEITAKVVLSNATPKVTYFDLLPKGTLPAEFEREVAAIDYTSGVTKINVALRGLPSFSADPSPSDGSPAPHHQCTCHLNSESVESIHQAYLDAQHGHWSQRPVIEACFPSSLDHTLAPTGCHVMSLFTQYTPYHLNNGGWTERRKEEYTDLVFDCIEEYAPGFKDLVIGRDILTPPDLERVFGLTGGNIFHGAMSVDQLYLARPTPFNTGCASRGVQGLYLCGSGAHPGGGIMGSAGRLAALAVLKQL